MSKRDFAIDMAGITVLMALSYGGLLVLSYLVPFLG